MKGAAWGIQRGVRFLHLTSEVDTLVSLEAVVPSHVFVGALEKVDRGQETSALVLVFLEPSSDTMHILPLPIFLLAASS